jgi:hypothetical protein
MTKWMHLWEVELQGPADLLEGAQISSRKEASVFDHMPYYFEYSNQKKTKKTNEKRHSRFAAGSCLTSVFTFFRGTGPVTSGSESFPNYKS